MPKPKLTQSGRHFAPKLLSVLLAFVLLCVGILLLARRVVPADTAAADESSTAAPDQETMAIRHARGSIRNAERALTNNNYGEVRSHLSQAYSALSRASQSP